MADLKPSAATNASVLDGTERIPCTQGGADRAMTPAQIKTFAGGGDVVGPAAATDNAIARFDATTGKLLQNGVVTESDAGGIGGVSTLLASGAITTGSGVIVNDGPGGDEKVQVAASFLLASDAHVKFYNNADISSGTPDIGLERSGAGTLEVTNGSTGQGALVAAQLTVDQIDLNGGKISTTSGELEIAPASNGNVFFNTTGFLYLGGKTSAFPAVTRKGQYLTVELADDSAAGPIKGSMIDVQSGSVASVAAAARLSGQTSAGSLQLNATGSILVSSDATLALSPTFDLGAKRDSAGAWLDTDGSTGLGKRLTGRVIEASTAGSGSPNLLIATESRKLLSNEGATAEAYNTLPLAAAGIEFVFYCQDTDGIRVVANTGDTIRIGSSVSAAAGFVRSSTVGSALILTAINATEWVAISVVGTWTVDS